MPLPSRSAAGRLRLNSSFNASRDKNQRRCASTCASSHSGAKLSNIRFFRGEIKTRLRHQSAAIAKIIHNRFKRVERFNTRPVSRDGPLRTDIPDEFNERRINLILQKPRTGGGAPSPGFLQSTITT